MVITTLLSQLLVAVPSIIVGTQTLTSTINGVFKINSTPWRHAISWIIAVVVALGFVATGGLSFGLPQVWQEYLVGGAAGVLAGGAANGFYDWDAIGNIFRALENVIRGEKKAQMLTD